MVQALGYFGENGWELVGVHDKASNWFANMEKGFMLLKRVVPDGEEPHGGWAEAWTQVHLDAATGRGTDFD